MAVGPSVQACSLSPSRPNATSAMSMSPPAHALRTTSAWLSCAAASKATVSTAQPPPSSRAGAASSRGEGRPASTTRTGRSVLNASTTARPISEVPPSSSTLCGLPRASIIRLLRSVDREGWASGQLEAAGQVGDEHPVRVDRVAHLAPLVEPWVAAADRLRARPGLLGQVVPAAGGEHQLVQLVAEVVEAAAHRDVHGD